VLVVPVALVHFTQRKPEAAAAMVAVLRAAQGALALVVLEETMLLGPVAVQAQSVQLPQQALVLPVVAAAAQQGQAQLLAFPAQAVRE
jgi:hypothetical protein